MNPKGLLASFRSFVLRHSIYSLVFVPWFLGGAIVVCGFAIGFMLPYGLWIASLSWSLGCLCMSLGAIPQIIKREAVVRGMPLIKGQTAVYVAIASTILLWIFAAIPLAWYMMNPPWRP